jgi:hypothetical protein
MTVPWTTCHYLHANYLHHRTWRSFARCLNETSLAIAVMLIRGLGVGRAPDRAVVAGSLAAPLIGGTFGGGGGGGDASLFGQPPAIVAQQPASRCVRTAALLCVCGCGCLMISIRFGMGFGPVFLLPLHAAFDAAIKFFCLLRMPLYSGESRASLTEVPMKTEHGFEAMVVVPAGAHRKVRIAEFVCGATRLLQVSLYALRHLD